MVDEGTVTVNEVTVTIGWTVANSFKTARSRKQDGNGNGTAMVTCQKQKIYSKYINDSQPFGRK